MNHSPIAAPANGARYWLAAESDAAEARIDGVGQGPGLVEDADDPGDGGLLLADGDVDAVERPVVRVAGGLGRAVEPRLADDRVDADRRLAGGAVADDQLALAAADRDHRVDRHDAGLHRLADRAPPDDAGGELLDRIRHGARDRPLVVERLAERVDDAAEEALADRHFEQAPGGADFVAFAQLRVVAEDDRGDFGLVEIEREAGDAAAEVEHLVQHDVAEPLDPGDAVADLADRADRLLGGRGLRALDLFFDFQDQVSHLSTSQERVRVPPAWRARVPSYTSLPTLIRTPPMSAGFSPNDVSSAGP